MPSRKKKSQPDPRSYATTSIPKAKEQPQEPTSSPRKDQLVPTTEDVPGPLETLTESSLPMEMLTATSVPTAMSMPTATPHRLKENWRERPSGMTPEQARELSKRLLQCQTKLGLVASVHLEKVNMRTGDHSDLARTVYSWIFEAHHVVMGDMNCSWASMIGGAQLDVGHSSKPKANLSAQTQEAWVKPHTHAVAIRKGGTYLPGLTVEKEPRWKGDKITVDPPAFDLVVVSRPMQVQPLDKQPGKAFQTAKLPRKQIQTLKWPSDHTSVVAEVKITSRSLDLLRVATWNVADPFYFSQFWPDAEFGFDRTQEDSRLLAIEQHVEELLSVADVIGLQEVPATLVKQLIHNGIQHQFEVQWVSAPSSEDEEWYLQCAGDRGHSSEGVTSGTLPPVAHDMLFCRAAIAVS